MDCGEYRYPGGIAGLRSFVDRHSGPLSYELLKIGKHLRDIGTEALDWAELRDFIRWLPPVPENALYRDMHPKSWDWNTNTEFQSMILYALQGANWQRGGSPEDKRPEMILRPDDFKTEPESEPEQPEQTFTLDTIKDELARRRAMLNG